MNLDQESITLLSTIAILLQTTYIVHREFMAVANQKLTKSGRNYKH